MRDGDLSLGGSCEKKAPHSRKPSHKYVYGSCGVSEDNVPGRTKEKTHRIKTHRIKTVFQPQLPAEK